MFCPNCNQQLEDGTKFCVHCGTKIPDEAPVAEPAPAAEPAPVAEAPVAEATPAAEPAQTPPVSVDILRFRIFLPAQNEDMVFRYNPGR